MLEIGALGFLQPWLLLGLLTLPALYLLLRLTPPSPRRLAFPPLTLLLDLVAREQTPARTPLWLLLLRMAIAALVILALAGPVLNPAPELAGRGPVLVVVDDGWAAAPRWDTRRERMAELFEQAEREGRELRILATAPDEDGVALETTTARAALEGLAGREPKPWPVDRAAALERLREAGLEAARVFWLTDGLADREGGQREAVALADHLARLGEVTVFAPEAGERTVLLRPPEEAAEAFEVVLERGGAGPERVFRLSARGPGGETLAEEPATLAADSAASATVLDLPADLLNRVARLELTPDQGAAGVVLFDERWRRRSVGIVGEADTDEVQPLLSESYYVERALLPYAEVRKGGVGRLLERPISVLVLTDRGQVDEDDRGLIEPWIEDGGILLRFAGPRLAAGADDLVPVTLRSGDRQLGGALSWSEPLPLAPFPADSPFAGLEPSPEATVHRQVLAEPGPELSRKTLASLEDGTPLVTAERRGRGWLMLVHTTANTSWASLPLSGLFVDMLRRVLAMAPGTGMTGEGQVRADAVLDARGRLVDPPAHLAPMAASRLAEGTVGPTMPPGLYAPTQGFDGGSEQARLALNLEQGVGPLEGLPLSSLADEQRGYAPLDEVDLAPWLLLAALLLALVDLLIAFAFRGLVPLPRGAAPTAGVVLAALAGPAVAQTVDDTRVVELTRETHLAYVRTGLGEVDEMSEAGLRGLTRVLGRRTSVEAGEPVAVDVTADELALFPLLYWPVPPEHPRLPEEVVDRVETYLRRGGMVLFDTLDAQRMLPGQEGMGPGQQRMAEILDGLDIPPLEPVPEDHVLTRSFYLLQEFPGRFTGQRVWVDQTPPGVNDGVAGVIIGAHDWAGAWAIDESGDSLRPVSPGGEDQREMARRFGVNLVMYALTGNYKTDQVHVPALLERLGQ